MKTDVRRKLDMADRVLIFNQAHPPTDPGSQVAFDQLAQRVTEAKDFAAEQRAGQAAARSGTKRRRELRANLQQGLLRYLIRVGEAAVQELPELAENFQLTRASATNRTFLNDATGMLADARSHEALFLKHGFTQAMFEELTGMLDQFTKAIEQASTGRQRHVAARADLQAVAAEIVVLVERINALNRHRFRDDPDLLAAWDSARNVFGPVKTRTAPAVSEPPSNPPSPVTPPADADQGT